MARSNHYVMAALNLCTAATPETAASLWQLQEDVLRARIDTKEWLGGLWYRCESNRRDEKAGDVVYEEIGEFDLGPSMAAAVGGAIGVGERPHKGKRRWRVCVCAPQLLLHGREGRRGRTAELRRPRWHHRV